MRTAFWYLAGAKEKGIDVNIVVFSYSFYFPLYERASHIYWNHNVAVIPNILFLSSFVLFSTFFFTYFCAHSAVIFYEISFPFLLCIEIEQHWTMINLEHSFGSFEFSSGHFPQANPFFSSATRWSNWLLVAIISELKLWKNAKLTIQKKETVAVSRMKSCCCQPVKGWFSWNNLLVSS